MTHQLRRRARSESGDTLIEVLIALVVIGLTSVALLGGFMTSIASSSVHRSIANADAILRSFAAAATYQIQLQPSPQFSDCASTSTYQVVSPYPSDASAGSTIEVFASSGFPAGGTVAVSLGGTALVVASGGTVPASSDVAATVVLPTSGLALGANTITLTATKGATKVVASAPFTVTSTATSPPVTTSLAGYAISIHALAYWNGTAFATSCTAGGNQSQLVTVRATGSTGSDTASFVVMNPRFVTSGPPTITSGASTTFTVGAAGSFTVQTAGSPTPTLSESGALPNGVTFTDNGNGTATISGTPAAGTSGTYPLTITANNGIAPNATQSFNLIVGGPPAISSANHATFTVGVAGSFTVTTTGSPAPALTESGGALPSNVTFADNGNGSATISGTPAAGTGGTYTFTITANNGIAPNASQLFTLTVDSPPAISSVNHATFTVGVAGSFTVTTTGSPAPALTESGGALPSNVTFTNNGNGTATISGTPAAGTGGTYTFTITANNGVAPNATQSFTLTVDQAPAFVSTDPNTCSSPAHKTVVCVTLATTGFPAPSYTATGQVASWVSFNPASGTSTQVSITVPNKQAAGTYTFNVVASNGVAPNATWTVTVTVT